MSSNMIEKIRAIVAAGLAVALSGLLGALQSTVWNGPEAPAAVRLLAYGIDPGLAAEAPVNTLAQPSESYFGYGRLAITIYALLLIAAFNLRRGLPKPTGTLLVAFMALAALADVGAYWVSEAQGPGLRRVAFWYTEVPALAATILILSSVGVISLRRGRPNRMLALCLPLSLGTTALLGYLPHGMLLGIALTLMLSPVILPAQEAKRVDERSRPGLLRRVRWPIATAVVCLVLALLYRPTLRPGPVIEYHESTIEEGLEGARLHVFNTGKNRVSWLLVGRDRPWRPVPAFVIEHPESGLFVFDTGLSDAVAERGEAGLRIPERWVIESRSSPDMTLPAQMRAVGLDPTAVHHVALSHFHGDHTGQLDAFPNARIIAGPGSAPAMAALSPDGLLPERFQEQTFDNTTRFGPFDQTVDMLGDQSVVLIRGGGHAREDLMLALALDEGPLLLSGDAVVHADWLASNDVQRIPVDPERAAVVRNQVRAFKASVADASVAYGHDLREVDCRRSDIVCHGAESFYPEDLGTLEP